MEPVEHLLASDQIVAYRLDEACLLPTLLSPGVTDFLGIGPDQLLAPNTEWVERQHPDERAFIQKRLDELPPGQEAVLSYRVLARGGYIWISDHVRREERGFVGFWLKDSARNGQTDFLRNLSHEFRTPMTGAIGMAQLLLESDLDADKLLYARTILRCNERLLRLLDNLLDYSHLEMGQLHREAAHFDPLVALERLATTFAPEAEAKQLDLVVCLHPDVPQQAFGDRRRIEQIVANLLDNAIKFTTEGQITLRAAPSPRGLRIEVLDTGPGIGPDTQRIFELFRQGDPSPSRRHGGLGLGLAVCMGFARLLGAELGADHRPEGGSLFWCDFPLQLGSNYFRPETLAGASLTLVGTHPDRVENARRWLASWDVLVGTGPELELNRHGVLPIRLAGQAEQLLKASLRRHRKRILIVEDNPGIQAVVSRLLERMGHTVGRANNGVEAVAAAREANWDLILMDCQMPEMNGFEATRAIRTLPSPARDVPIVALTANTLEGDQRACLEAGMNDYLSKPVRRTDLERLLNQGVGSRAASRNMVESALDPEVISGLLELSEPGHDSLFANLVGLFDQKGREEIQTLQRLSSQAKGPALSIAAHGLKSTAATLGAIRLVEACQKLESAARNDQLASSDELVQRVEREYRLALGELQEQLVALKKAEGR
ncbi:MAG: response regulator [Candidatus Eremiobacteraeota bacterium]|nr:response regulator [Candidatus Eremiobacteraeota bacterium]